MSELRYDYLKNRWIVISPERSLRPHRSISIEEKQDEASCPFEYGKEKLTPPEIFAIREPGTLPNSPGWKVRVIPNKYPALKMEQENLTKRNFHISMQGVGFHEIVIETPEHYKQFYDFSQDELVMVFTAYRERMRKLYSFKEVKYVHIFKNHGIIAGASLTHPHSQIIAVPKVPETIETMISQNRKYFKENLSCYLCDEVNYELSTKERIVYVNELFVAYCPFASDFPFKVRVLPKIHSLSFSNTEVRELKLLADAIFSIMKKLKSQLGNSFSFNMILYSSPKGISKELFHWHIDLLPRLEAIAGFELGTGWFINSVPPEQAAKLLRNTEI